MFVRCDFVPNAAGRCLRRAQLFFFLVILAGSANFKALAKPELKQDEKIPVAAIDFFGYAGLDTEKVRSALPVRVGDFFPSISELHSLSPKIKEVVLQVTGRPATNVAMVQAGEDLLIYIGLSGGSTKKFKLNSEPTGDVKLPAEAVELYDETMNLLRHAVATGASEDDSKGYALSSDPPYRAKQLATHEYAAQHEELLREVLANSADVKQRLVAAHFLGYANQSQAQIDALVAATRDPDGTVRNNAIRALGVLASSDPKVAARIPAAPFIDMLSSEMWTDRNKAGFLLSTLTKDRNVQLLAQLRARALTPLIEMARWHDAGHATVYRVILGRIGAIDEARLQQIAQQFDQVEAIISAAQNARIKR